MVFFLLQGHGAPGQGEVRNPSNLYARCKEKVRFSKNFYFKHRFYPVKKCSSGVLETKEGTFSSLERVYLVPEKEGGVGYLHRQHPELVNEHRPSL